MAVELAAIDGKATINPDDMRVGGIYRGYLYKDLNAPVTFLVAGREFGDVVSGTASHGRKGFSGMTLALAFQDNADRLVCGDFAKFTTGKVDQFARDFIPHSFESVGSVFDKRAPELKLLCEALSPNKLIVRKFPNLSEHSRLFSALLTPDFSSLILRFQIKGKLFALENTHISVLHPEHGNLEFKKGVLFAPQQG